MKSICNKCGAIEDDMDAGFSPAAHGMMHECGGKWVDYAAYLMGKKKTAKKAKSSAENGKKGGRPKSKKIVVVYSLRGVEIGRHETGDNFTDDNLQEWTDWLNDDAVEHPGLPRDADGYQVKGWEFELIPN